VICRYLRWLGRHSAYSARSANFPHSVHRLARSAPRRRCHLVTVEKRAGALHIAMVVVVVVVVVVVAAAEVAEVAEVAEAAEAAEVEAFVEFEAFVALVVAAFEVVIVAAFVGKICGKKLHSCVVALIVVAAAEAAGFGRNTVARLAHT